MPYVLAKAAGPSDLVAQSMGSVVATLVALQRPDRVRRLVLVATSGGVDLTRFEVADWRPEYRRELPGAPAWFVDDPSDLTAQLPSITAPTLLIWGADDPISPASVGRHLADLLPKARLVVIEGAGHDVAITHADAVATLIEAHLTRD